MRKITLEACTAFINGVPYSKSNMRVALFDGFALMALHGNIIAKRGTTDDSHVVVLSTGGWKTNTTKERLNGLLKCLNAPFFIVQKNYRWYITDGKTKVPWESGHDVQHWLDALSLT